MSKDKNNKTKAQKPAVDKPATTLLKAWEKRISQGSVTPIPVYVGGAWSLQIPRGNKRLLQLSVNSK